MAVYSLRGRTTATPAVTGEWAFTVWNPASPPVRVVLLEVGVFRDGITGTRLHLIRSSTRGTAATTVTPTADNCWNGLDAPMSGLVLDTGFSANPTVLTPGAFTISIANVTGSGGAGWVWAAPQGFAIAPGSGAGIRSATATIWPASEVYVVWEEG